MSQQPFPDVYGEALRDFYNGITDHPLIVHSDIAEDEAYPVDYFFRSDFPEMEKLAMDLCSGRILDVGAGTGNHALYLQSVGKDVTAIDTSNICVDIMAKRGITTARNVDFFDMNDSFDTLLMLMNGFGVMGTVDRIPEFLKKAHSILKTGGKIIFDSSDLIHLYQEEDGSVLIDLNAGYHGEVEFTMEYKGQLGAPFMWLFVGSDIIADLAPQFGFTFEILLRGENNHYLAQLTKQ